MLRALCLAGTLARCSPALHAMQAKCDADGTAFLASASVDRIGAGFTPDEADRLRDTLGSGVVVLGSREGGAVKLVVTVSKDLAGKRVHAGNLIREIAGMVGGGGGGRPDMAQAGGKNPDALPGALDAVYALVQG